MKKIHQVLFRSGKKRVVEEILSNSISLRRFPLGLSEVGSHHPHLLWPLEQQFSNFTVHHMPPGDLLQGKFLGPAPEPGKVCGWVGGGGEACSTCESACLTSSSWSFGGCGLGDPLWETPFFSCGQEDTQFVPLWALRTVCRGKTVRVRGSQCYWSFHFSSVAQSCPTLRPHGLQHARLPSPSPTPGVYSNSCPQSRWCHPTNLLSRPLLLLPSVFPSIRVFSNESVLCIRWPKYWSFSFSISPSNEYSGLISYRMYWLDKICPFSLPLTLWILRWYPDSGDDFSPCCLLSRLVFRGRPDISHSHAPIPRYLHFQPWHCESERHWPVLNRS